MFWSVHDHPDGGNRTGAGVQRRAERRGGLHVDRDCAGREQIGPFLTSDDMIGAGERSGVDGAARYGPHEFLDE